MAYNPQPTDDLSPREFCEVHELKPVTPVEVNYLVEESEEMEKVRLALEGKL